MGSRSFTVDLYCSALPLGSLSIRKFCSSIVNPFSLLLFIKSIDLLGRDTDNQFNSVLFYIYDDGSVEKRIVIE